MHNSLLLVLYVTIAWWSTTGAILFLGRLPPATYRWSLTGATVVMIAALATLVWSRDLATATGACVAFGAAVLVWGWLEMTFLLGGLTGPRRHACAPGCDGRAHFWHSVQSILYHELLALTALISIGVISARAANPYGFLTFALLWIMRISAKLNLHFGVPNVAEAMLPPHLQYLSSFFRQRPLNRMFATSVLLVAALTGTLIFAAWKARFSSATGTGLTLLATLSTLALLEHGMLVISMPADSFWTWMRQKREGSKTLIETEAAAARAGHSP